MTTNTTLTAGQKAAKTRRANQLKAKRRQAALLSWETRRYNATLDRVIDVVQSRSERAHRAWATRRANA